MGKPLFTPVGVVPDTLGALKLCLGILAQTEGVGPDVICPLLAAIRKLEALMAA